MQPDDRQYAPAAARNVAPILAVLDGRVPSHGLVLELASGTGEHAVAIARRFPGLTVQPSDPAPAARRSIAAWIAASGLPNLRPPLDLDAMAHRWPVDAAQLVLAINLIHIAPWGATLGLFAGAARVLVPDGTVFLYGPYRRHGAATAPSNQAFDDWLQARDPAWGVRDLEAVADAAAAAGFAAPEIVEMPANNLSLLFRRRAVSVPAAG